MMNFDFGNREEEDVWRVLARLGPILRPVGDSFFDDGDGICEMKDPQIFENFDTESFLHKDYEPFPCSVEGCKKVFAQLIDSETHYNTVHRYPCSECKKGFISAHLLDLHVLENHDAFFKLLSKKKPSYSCFLEICKAKFWNRKERTAHGLEAHKFESKLLFFENVEKEEIKESEGILSKKKKPRRPNSVALSSPPQEPKKSLGPSPAKSTTNLSASKVPPVLRPSKIPIRSFSYKNLNFGDGITKTFDSTPGKPWYSSRIVQSKKRNSMEIDNMEDVKKSLPGIK